MERYDLPDGWEWRELAQVVEIGSEQVNPFRFPDDLFNYLALENIEQGSGKVIDFTPTLGKNIKSNKFKFTSKHVLYGKLRPYLRKAFAPEFEGVSATDLLPLLPDENNLDRKYLVWWLLSPQILDYVVGKQTGVKMPRLRSNDLAQMPIPLPPLPEQQRIVAKIESLFEQSRAARAALTRVPALMSQFRRAVLASAFRGELVEPDPNDEPAASLLERIRDTREQSGYKKTIEPIDTSDLPELPEGWEWVKIEQIGDVSGGLTKNSKRSALSEKLPYLRVANVYFNRLELSDVQDIGIQESELERTLLKKGDLLVVEGNGSIEQIGRVAVWDGSIEPCVHQNHVIKIRFSPTDISRYILFWLLSTEGRDQIMKVTSSTSGLYTLSLSKVSQLLVPLAPLALQSRIVAKIEALFAQADIIEQAASVSLRRAEQVDQSILARAFRGELG